MTVTPFENIRLTSLLDEEEIMNRITSRLEYTKQFGFAFHKNSIKDWEGFTSKNQFIFRRILKFGSNSFIPTANGILENYGEKNVILIRIRLHNAVYFTLTILTVFDIILLISEPTFFSLVFCFIPYTFCTTFYNLESNILKSEISEILK